MPLKPEYISLIYFNLKSLIEKKNHFSSLKQFFTNYGSLEPGLYAILYLQMHVHILVLFSKNAYKRSRKFIRIVHFNSFSFKKMHINLRFSTNMKYVEEKGGKNSIAF